MAIILEGFDNSGKSTLARLISEAGFSIYHPGPKPKNKVEEATCLIKQRLDCGGRVIMDRVTAISQQCYRDRIGDSELCRYANLMAATPRCVIIYCRPPMDKILDLSSHEVKGYDDAEHLKWLEVNAGRVVRNYDKLMATLPHRVFDWISPDPGVIADAIQAQASIEQWIRWQTTATPKCGSTMWPL
jgi:thymidylate kinase